MQKCYYLLIWRNPFLPRHFISMQEIDISMQEVKNYYAGRKGSPREVQHPANSDHYLLLVTECFDCCCGKLCGFQNLEQSLNTTRFIRGLMLDFAVEECFIISAVSIYG